MIFTSAGIPSYLISFIPADILHFGKFLGSLHHKVNEVPTSTQAADDEKVGQDTEKSCQMDIFFFVTLLFIHYWLLDVWKWNVNYNKELSFGSWDDYFLYFQKLNNWGGREHCCLVGVSSLRKYTLNRWGILRGTNLHLQNKWVTSMKCTNVQNVQISLVTYYD